MSSRKFVAELIPETRLRLLLLGSGWLAYLLGCWTILSIAAAERMQLGMVSIWTLLLAARCAAVLAVQLQYRAIRIGADGTVCLLDRLGIWRAGRLHKDSLVLSSLAWIRVTRRNGPPYYELLRGDSRENEQWRRLQVIWRHMGSGS